MDIAGVNNVHSCNFHRALSSALSTPAISTPTILAIPAVLLFSRQWYLWGNKTFESIFGNARVTWGHRALPFTAICA